MHVTGPVPAAISSALARELHARSTRPSTADGVLATLPTRVDDAFLDAAGPQLRVVANYGVGVDNIDLEAARARGIVVANTPDVLTETTAELAIALTLALLRRVAEGDRLLRARRAVGVRVEFMLGEGLRGKRFAVVGPGRIGRATARLAEAFGARPRLRRARRRLARAARDGRHRQPALPADAGDAAPDRRARARRDAPDRGARQHGARADRRRARARRGAARRARSPAPRSTCFEHEPAVAEELLALENVVVTPHLGSATRETREAMGMLAVGALRAVLLEDRRPPNVVA